MVTVLGASGFIGSHLVARLRDRGEAVLTPSRNDPLPRRGLGTVLYCLGVTADYRTRPLDTVEAHVTKLGEVLSRGNFDRLVYLSSTRVYRRCPGPCSEADVLMLNPMDPDDVYDLSKAMGESLALSCSRDTTVVRLSNVYGLRLGSPDFLPTVISAAILRRLVVVQQAPESAKDYVALPAVVDLLQEIAMRGRERIYNVASGTLVSHTEIADILARVTGCRVEFVPGAPAVLHPRISTERVAAEFDHRPTSLLKDLPGLVAEYVAALGVRA